MKTDRIPLYQQIQDYIRELIAASDLKHGDRIPTEKELMDRFHVSKITVVNALAGLVNEGLISRIPGRGSFVNLAPGDGAAGTNPSMPQGSEAALNALRLPKRADTAATVHPEKRMVGIIMPSIEDYFSIRLIDGMKEGLEESGFMPVILLSGGSLEREQEAIRMCMDMGAGGLLIFPVDEDLYNEDIIGLKFSGHPFVLIDRYLPGVETDYIASDGKYGTRLAVDYLWGLGHREIAICTDSPAQTVTVQERIEGYMEALKDKGALVNPAHIIKDFRLGSPAEELTHHPLYRYIKNRLATAYIALNGKLGAHILKMAEHAELQVPRDLSVITFDDPTSFMDGYHTFTHIKQFERDIGYQAARLLAERMHASGRDKGKYSKILIKPELVVKHTTGPCDLN